MRKNSDGQNDWFWLEFVFQRLSEWLFGKVEMENLQVVASSKL